MSGKNYDEVSEDEAVKLLAETQACSEYFKDFDFQQLLDLQKELAILKFAPGETVMVQGEPAQYFGVLLQGGLKPMLDGQPLGAERGVGMIIGEGGLFSGGARNASMVATSEGYLAVVTYAELARLDSANPPLAAKLSEQLATAELAKALEREGSSLDALGADGRAARVRALLEKMEEFQWDQHPPEIEAAESILRRANTIKSSKERKVPHKLSKAKSSTFISESADGPAAYTELPSELPVHEAFEKLQALQSAAPGHDGGAGAGWLQALNDDELQELTYAAAAASFKPGEVLFAAGEQAMSVALLLAGSTAELVGSELLVRNAGDFLGAAGLFVAGARRGDTVCVEPGLVLLFAYPDVAELCRRSPAAGSRLVEAIARAHAEAGGEGVDEAAMAAAPTPAAAADAAAAALVAAYGSLDWGAKARSLPPESFCVAIRGKATVRAKRSIGQLEERRTTGAKGDGDALAKPLLPSHVPPPQVLLLLHAFASQPWLRGHLNLKELTLLSRAVAVVRINAGHVLMRQARPRPAPPAAPRRRAARRPARSPRPLTPFFRASPPPSSRSSSRAAPRGTSAASACARCPRAPPSATLRTSRAARARAI